MVYLISYTWSWTKAAENNGMIALIRPMMAAPCPVARFTNDFLLAIQIWWTLCFVVIQYLAIRSQHIFAHATTAQLSCHVQKSVAITLLHLMWQQNEIFI